MNKINRILLPIAIVAILALAGIFILRNLSVKDNTDKNIELSDRAETFSISGAEASNFLEVIFDPFEVKEGEKQKIIVTLKNPDEIELLEGELKDETELQEKIFKQVLLQKEENQASYQIIWQPKEIESNKSYPVKFEYLTKLGEKNVMTLFWHAESF